MCMLDDATFHILSTSRISLRHIYEPGDKVQGVTSTVPPTVVIPFGNSSRRGRRLGRRSTQITFLLDTNYFNIDLYCHHRTTQGVP